MKSLKDTNEGWHRVGSVMVDSGSVAVGDPCYTNGADASNASKDWNDFLAKTWPRTFSESDIGPSIDALAVDIRNEQGVGIVVSSGYGDGEYPVFVKVVDEGSWGKRIAEMKVVFIGDEVDGGF